MRLGEVLMLGRSLDTPQVRAWLARLESRRSQLETQMAGDSSDGVAQRLHLVHSLLVYLRQLADATTPANRSDRTVVALLRAVGPLHDDSLAIPANFVSEPLGRQLTVFRDDDAVLAREGAEHMLSAFLPGGFKIRWESEGVAGSWMVPWERASHHVGPNPENSDPRWHRLANVDASFPDATDPRAWRDAVRDEYDNWDACWVPEVRPDGGGTVELLFPQQLRVREYRQERLQFFPQPRVVLSSPGDLSADDQAGAEPVRREPQSQPLSFFGLPDAELPQDDLALPVGDGGSCTFYRRLRLCRHFYASLVTIYRKDDDNVEGLERFYSRSRNAQAVVALPMETQGVLLSLTLSRECVQRALDTLADRPWLLGDLRWAWTAQHLWRDTYVGQGRVRSRYELPNLLMLLPVLAWRSAVGADGTCTRSPAGGSDIAFLSSGPTPTPLDLLGISTNTVDLLTRLDEPLWRGPGPAELEQTCIEVAAHTLAHLVGIHAQTETGASAARLRTLFFVQRETDAWRIRVALFDNDEGGSGLTRGYVERVRASAEAAGGYLRLIVAQTQGCRSRAVEEVVRERLLQSARRPSLTECQSLTEDLAEGWLQTTGAPLDECVHLAGLARRRLGYFAAADQTWALARAATRTWSRLREELAWTPRPAETMLAMRDSLLPPAARAAFDSLASSSRGQGGAQPLLVQIQDGLGLCHAGCEDCLAGSGCEIGFTYCSDFLDRHVVGTLLGEPALAAEGVA